MQEINNVRQESSVQDIALEEIQARIQQCVDNGTGRTHCRCGEPIDPEHIDMYPHEEGIQVEGLGRQWVFIRCPKCGYCWALWKLDMQLDMDREVAECP